MKVIIDGLYFNNNDGEDAETSVGLRDFGNKYIELQLIDFDNSYMVVNLKELKQAIQILESLEKDDRPSNS